METRQIREKRRQWELQATDDVDVVASVIAVSALGDLFGLIRLRASRSSAGSVTYAKEPAEHHTREPFGVTDRFS